MPAYLIAQSVMQDLLPGCERVEIAGSLRREKPEVNDIELVAIPYLKPPRPEFGQKVIFKTPLDKMLIELEQKVRLRRIKGGDKYKQYWIKDGPFNVIKLDLFLVTPPAQWGVQFVIRSGPNKPDNNFSQWMVTEKRKGGALPDGYIVQDGAVGRKVMYSSYKAERKGLIEMPEEEDYFRFCGLDWIEPVKRVAKWAPNPAFPRAQGKGK